MSLREKQFERTRSQEHAPVIHILISGDPFNKERRGITDYKEQEGSNSSRMPAPGNDLAGMSDDLLSTSLPCANFAKIYPLSKMIYHHLKNRLKIQKQCHYFSVSEKVPVLNNRSRALLA